MIYIMEKQKWIENTFVCEILSVLYGDRRNIIGDPDKSLLHTYPKKSNFQIVQNGGLPSTALYAKW